MTTTLEITNVEILKRIEKTAITPKMERAIRTQYKVFFPKSEDYVIDYDLFYKVDNYKSFNAIEKAKISYETLSRLYAGIVFNEGFLNFWEDKVKEYMLEEQSIGIIDILNLDKTYITNKEIRILKSKNKHIKNNGYETDYESWAESIRSKAVDKCNSCHFVKRYKGIDIYEVDVEIAGYSETKKGDTIFATVRLYEKWKNDGTMDDFVYRIVA